MEGPQSNELRSTEWLLTHYRKVQQEVDSSRSHMQRELKIDDRGGVSEVEHHQVAKGWRSDQADRRRLPD